MTTIDELEVKIFADGADIDGIIQLARNPLIKGYTTNPTLMRQAGVTDYLGFCRDALTVIGDKPISLEVFSDDFDEMRRQAQKLSQLGDNVYVKIPVTNTKSETSFSLIRDLCTDGVKVNVTALFTVPQVEGAVRALADGPASFISIFAGRIADAGVDPLPTMTRSLEIMSGQNQIEMIWASPREVLNVVQANDIGCHVITMTHDLLKKISSIGKNLELFSLETVKMFATDAQQAGYIL